MSIFSKTVAATLFAALAIPGPCLADSVQSQADPAPQPTPVPAPIAPPTETTPPAMIDFMAPLLQEFVVDRSNRMTVAVKINGSKDFPFIIDTGSERTVIANELAQYLNLESGEALNLATVSGPATVNSFLIDKLNTETLSMSDVEAPGLQRQNLGAYGLLGIDSLQGKKLLLNLKAGKMEVLESKRRRGRTKLERGMIIVTAQRKAGRLILSDARVNGIKVDIVLDTGAQSSMGNYALRNILQRRDRKGAYQPVEMRSVIGDRMVGEYTQLRSIEIGGFDITDLPITFSENYAMKTLGLSKKPAIFLGMDALDLFDRVLIDFVNRRISFALPKDNVEQRGFRFGQTASRLDDNPKRKK